ncbi:MAG: NADH-quinone oxidoreductase subunit J [Verrucomicrobiales bacterium]|nr:NADH-quinone oxidoreductase subunit J [Verrucomicrobiales bacterium]
MSPIFYFLAMLTLGGAVAAMSLRNPVHCALSLVVTFVGLAGVYLGLGAHFLGLSQVLVYVGAVAILLVFVLLLTRGSGKDEFDERPDRWWPALGVGGGLGGVLIAVVLAQPGLALRTAPPELPTVRALGESLMTDFVLPLQVVGVLLTAALIGAAVLALSDRRRTPQDSGPVTSREEGETRR